MSHLSPGAKLQAQKEFLLRRHCLGQPHFTPSSAACKCWAPQDSGRIFPPDLPVTGALHFSCSLLSCRLLFQNYWSKGVKATGVPCGRAAQNEVFSSPSTLTFPCNTTTGFTKSTSLSKRDYATRPCLAKLAKNILQTKIYKFWWSSPLKSQGKNQQTKPKTTHTQNRPHIHLLMNQGQKSSSGAKQAPDALCFPEPLSLAHGSCSWI